MPTTQERVKKLEKKQNERVKNTINPVAPKYAKLKFSNEDSFMKFLSHAAKQVLHFKDRGQDIQKMWIAESGEIIHTALPQKRMIGLFVKRQTLHINRPILVWDSKEKAMITFHNLLLDKIEDNGKH